MDPQPSKDIEVPPEDPDARLPAPAEEPPIGTDIVPPEEPETEPVEGAIDQRPAGG